MMHPCELPIRPKPGEAWIALELTAIDQPIALTLNELFNLGYQPELRYRQSKDGTIALFAVLRHVEKAPDYFVGINDYWGDDLDLLAENFPPDAISSPRGLPRRVAVAV